VHAHADTLHTYTYTHTQNHTRVHTQCHTQSLTHKRTHTHTHTHTHRRTRARTRTRSGYMPVPPQYAACMPPYNGLPLTPASSALRRSHTNPPAALRARWQARTGGCGVVVEPVRGTAPAPWDGVRSWRRPWGALRRRAVQGAWQAAAAVGWRCPTIACRQTGIQPVGHHACLPVCVRAPCAHAHVHCNTAATLTLCPFTSWGFQAGPGQMRFL